MVEKDKQEYTEKEAKRMVGKAIIQGLTSPLFCFGAFPTMMRRAKSLDEKMSNEFPIITGTTVFASITSVCWVYTKLHQYNPKLVPYIIGAQVATTIGSGIYEYVKSMRRDE